jgi:homospermidine synthase
MTGITVPQGHRFDFEGDIVIFGGGSVSRCFQQLLHRHLGRRGTVTVADMNPHVAERMDPALVAAGARFEQVEITADNVCSEVARLAGRAGLVVNLTTGIHSGNIIAACHKADALYLDTSNEVWEKETPPETGYAGGLLSQTLWAREMAVREMARSWPARSRTALGNNGANPGLITYWVRRGLADLAGHLLTTGQLDAESAGQAERALAAPTDWALLAYALGVKVIIDAEWDTQSILLPRPPFAYHNTWSVFGYIEEGLWGPVEVARGTVQVQLPAGAVLTPDGCQFIVPRLGVEALGLAWVPGLGTIIGTMVRHAENLTIAEALTLRRPDRGRGAQLVSRPSVWYCYRSCDDSQAGMLDCRQNGFTLPDHELIVTDDQVADGGADTLGALLLGAPAGWWCGASTSVEHSRKIAPGHNPTTLQVAASITAGIRWMIEHPYEGLCNPEHVADRWHEEFLSLADPYMGESPSVRTSWTPDDYWRRHPMAPLRRKVPDEPDRRTWQFENFCVGW